MDYIAAIQSVGVAGACLMALGLAVWRSIIWLGTYILKPMAERHIKFLDELSTAMASQSQALQTMSIQQGRNLEGLDRIMENISTLIKKQEEVRDQLVKDRKELMHDAHTKPSE